MNSILGDPDFRWKGGRNHGLGDILIKNKIPPIASGLRNWPNSTPIFHDEPGVGGYNGIIRNDTHDGKQYNWFVPREGKGLTKAGLGRLNRSVEAYVYCILGSQVNVRSSITGGGGGAQEAQQEMLNLFESAIIEENISESVQRYQLAVQESHLRLNLVISPYIWLMPSNLIINLSSVEGYNNKLKKATPEMKFGVNVDVNLGFAGS